MIDEIALKVLEKRYLARDEAGATTETVEDMFRRVADHVAGSDGARDPDVPSKNFRHIFSDDVRP